MARARRDLQKISINKKLDLRFELQVCKIPPAGSFSSHQTNMETALGAPTSGHEVEHLLALGLQPYFFQLAARYPQRHAKAILTEKS